MDGGNKAMKDEEMFGRVNSARRNSSHLTVPSVGEERETEKQRTRSDEGSMVGERHSGNLQTADGGQRERDGKEPFILLRKVRWPPCRLQFQTEAGEPRNRWEAVLTSLYVSDLLKDIPAASTVLSTLWTSHMHQNEGMFVRELGRAVD